MSMNFNIAIDGPAGSGKSTVAKLVAKKLNFKYINTGLMYRTIAYLMKENNWNINNPNLLIQNYKQENVKFISDANIIYKNENIVNHLREGIVSKLAADVAKEQVIRNFCVLEQQRISKENNVVMDGRDIGSVVLPHAQLKIYMWATPEERAKRRIEQDQALGHTYKYEDVLKEIKERDYLDMHRLHSPLIQTPDAIRIDTTHMSLDKVVEEVLRLAKGRINV